MTLTTLLLMQVVGAFVNLGHWLPLMVDSVAAPQASFTTRVNTLVVLAAMLYAAGTSCSITNTSAAFVLPIHAATHDACLLWQLPVLGACEFMALSACMLIACCHVERCVINATDIKSDISPFCPRICLDDVAIYRYTFLPQSHIRMCHCNTWCNDMPFDAAASICPCCVAGPWLSSHSFAAPEHPGCPIHHVS